MDNLQFLEYLENAFLNISENLLAMDINSALKSVHETLLIVKSEKEKCTTK